jgi:hypothetical protein
MREVCTSGSTRGGNVTGESRPLLSTLLFGLVALAATRLSKSPACPALACVQTLVRMRHRLAFEGWAYHFPSVISF